jgi:hypothetical protein
VGRHGAEVDHSRDEVVVLKLHGSVDWFNRKQYRILDESRTEQGLKPGHPHPVFGLPEPMCTVPLIDGPRLPDDTLSEMYRFLDAESLYRDPPFFRATPTLLNPSPAKIIYSTTFRDFWWGLQQAGVFNFGMAIIGYSLPPQDQYARQVLYNLVKNYQLTYWQDGVLGQKKTSRTHRSSAVSFGKALVSAQVRIRKSTPRSHLFRRV